MRRFTLGSATDRKIVVIELNGTRVSVVQMMPDGSTKRSEKDLRSEAEARSASEQMARELISRGYVEKKKTGGKKKKKKTQSGEALEKHVLAGIAAVGVVFVGFIGFVIYDAFVKPPTIVGTWRGSMVEHEISRRLTITKYDLILDEQKRAELMLQEASTFVGTYSVQGDRLKLTLEDEDGESSERQYKI